MKAWTDLKQGDHWVALARGPLAVATLAIILEVLSQAGFAVPNVDAFLILLVAYVAFVDGIAAGVVGAIVAVLYYGYSTSPGARIFHIAVLEWEHLLIVGTVMPVLALIIGVLRRDLEKATAREVATRRQLDTVLESMDAGFYTLDREGRVTYMNTRAARHLGVASDKPVGRSVSEFDGRLPGSEEALALARKKRDAVSVQEWHDPERDIWYDVQAHPLAGGAAVYFADVTERRRMQERAEGAARMEALGHLAGGIAHDFNNLLTAIRGFTELVLSDLPPEDPNRASLDEVSRAAERAARLTRQLLAYTRRQVLQPEPLDLNRRLADMHEMLRRLIRSDVVLVTDFDRRLFPVQADAGQLEQIIMNLVVNGSDAMPSGGRLTLRTSRQVLSEPARNGNFVIEPGQYVVLTVEDTGVGMDAATKERIFEPFFTTKDRSHGTGLGLATVYGIVKQSGGYILVESEPGRGARFDVWLPRAEGEATMMENERSESGKPTEGITILLVEDDDAVRALATTVLRGRGYRVVVAHDGIEALAAANEAAEPPDLLLTDVVMPGMSGRELVKQLTGRWPGLKVVYTSGYTNESLIQDGISRGVLEPDIAFLQKPFTPAELIARVVESVGESGPR